MADGHNNALQQPSLIWPTASEGGQQGNPSVTCEVGCLASLLGAGGVDVAGPSVFNAP